MPYYNKMRLFTVLPTKNTATATTNLVKPPPPSIEEQDKLNRRIMYSNMFSINLQTHYKK